MMNNDIKGMCLFAGFMGLAYVAMMILMALFTGFKIVKGALLVTTLVSLSLVSMGLKPQVRERLVEYAKSSWRD